MVRVHPSLDPSLGGIVSALMATSTALVDDYDLTIVTQDGSAAHHDPFVREGITVRTAPRGGTMQALRELPPIDLVVLDGSWNTSATSLVRFCRQHHVPYVYVPHGSLSSLVRHQFPVRHLKKLAYWWAVEGPVARSAASLWYSSDIERQLSARTFPGTPRDSFTIPFATRDVGRLPPRALAPDEPLRIAVAARVAPVKDLDVLLQALAGLLTPWHLDVAGDDRSRYADDLKELARRLGIARSVTWHGYLQPTDLDEVLAGAHVYACPGLESFGMSVAEALSANLPVVASDAVALAPSLEGAGTVFPRGDVGALGAAIAETGRQLRGEGYGDGPRHVWESISSADAFRAAFTEAVGPLLSPAD